MIYKNQKFDGKNFETINKILNAEINQFNEYLNLIGSGSYPFRNVLKALGTPMSQNPAEGFPGKRYFPACNNLDELENLGKILAFKFFNIDYNLYDISLQPHSGTQANHIVFNSLYDKDNKVTIISMSTAEGGHVSHNIYPKKFFNLVNYTLDDDSNIDYQKLDKLCSTNKPALLIAGASSYPQEINYKKIFDICKKYNIRLLADISHTSIFVAASKHLSPFGYADYVTMTTNKGIRGPRGGIIFFKKKYNKEIYSSIFPLTQGSPKYNEILSKVVMFQELLNMDFNSYVDKVLSLSNIMIDFFKSKNCKIYTSGTSTHLVILDLSEEKFSGRLAEEKLLNVNILANRNLIPNDTKKSFETSGIRFGTICPAILNFSSNEMLEVCKIIYNSIFFNDYSGKDLIKNLLKSKSPMR